MSKVEIGDRRESQFSMVRQPGRILRTESPDSEPSGLRSTVFLKIAACLIALVAFAEADVAAEGLQLHSVPGIEAYGQYGLVNSAGIGTSVHMFAGDAMLNASAGIEAGELESDGEELDFNSISFDGGILFPLSIIRRDMAMYLNGRFTASHEGIDEYSLGDGTGQLTGLLFWHPNGQMNISMGVSWSPDADWPIPLLGYSYEHPQWNIDVLLPVSAELHYKLTEHISPGIFASLESYSVVREDGESKDLELTRFTTGSDIIISLSEGLTGSLRIGAAIDIEEGDSAFFGRAGLQFQR